MPGISLMYNLDNSTPFNSNEFEKAQLSLSSEEMPDCDTITETKEFIIGSNSYSAYPINVFFEKDYTVIFEGRIYDNIGNEDIIELNAFRKLLGYLSRQ